jgi:hypothetical protein
MGKAKLSFIILLTAVIQALPIMAVLLIGFLIFMQ